MFYGMKQIGYLISVVSENNVDNDEQVFPVLDRHTANLSWQASGAGGAGGGGEIAPRAGGSGPEK